MRSLVICSRAVADDSTDPEWKAFTVDDPSWLAIEEGGVVANECLKGFHAQRVDFTGRNFGLEVSLRRGLGWAGADCRARSQNMNE